MGVERREEIGDKEAWQSVNKAMTRQMSMPQRSMPAQTLSRPPPAPQRQYADDAPPKNRKEGEEV